MWGLSHHFAIDRNDAIMASNHEGLPLRIDSIDYGGYHCIQCQINAYTTTIRA
jgi:hypothetical protein